MTIQVSNPRTGEADYSIEALSREDIAAAAKRLRAAQPGWLALGAANRAGMLRDWADAIQAALPAIVSQLSVDTGRIAIANVEVFGVIRSEEHTSELQSPC